MAEWFLGASSSPLLYRRHVFEGFRVPQLAGAEDWPAKPACPPKPWRRRKLADAAARLRPLGFGAAALLAEFTLGPRGVYPRATHSRGPGGADPGASVGW